MTLTKADHHQFAEAAEQMSVAICNAETAFAFLARLHGDRDHEGHHGFEAVNRLCALGLQQVMNDNDRAVEGLIAWHRKEGIE